MNNAGIQTLIDFTAAESIDPNVLGREVDVNLKRLLYVTNAFLPLLKKQPTARVIHVGSGLGYVPLTAAPVYSATKAAVHSFRRPSRPSFIAARAGSGQSRKPPRA